MNKKIKDVSMIAGVALLVITGILYYFANLRKEKYEIYFMNNEHEMEIVKLSIDGNAVPVKKSEIRDKDYKIEIEYTAKFKIDGVEGTCAYEKKWDLSKDKMNEIPVTLSYSEFYKNYAVELWKNLQSVDVTYGEVKKFDSLVQKIEKWGDEDKNKMYKQLNDRIIKKIVGTSWASGEDEVNRQTVKVMIDVMYDFFEKFAGKQLTIDYVKTMTEKYKSYLTDDQKKGFKNVLEAIDKAEDKEVAFGLYENLLKYDIIADVVKLQDGTKLGDFFEIFNCK